MRQEILDIEGMIKVEAIIPLIPTDQRGNTFSLYCPKRSKEMLVVHRKRGQRFGGHYHLGNDPSKNPEKLFLAYGWVKALFIKDGQRERMILKPGNFITIYPRTHHFLEVLRDEAVIVEIRTTFFDKENPDTESSGPFPKDF